jgi:hypothetical protein
MQFVAEHANPRAVHRLIVRTVQYQASWTLLQQALHGFSPDVRPVVALEQAGERWSVLLASSTSAG